MAGECRIIDDDVKDDDMRVSDTVATTRTN